MAYFDTHCHLDLYPDPAGLVAEAERAQTYVIAVTNAPVVFEATQRLVAGSRFVRAALGLHPELAVERQLELPLFEQLLPQTRYVGEVGLDFVTRDAAARRVQQRVFAHIVDRCQAAGNKVLTIHSRRAEREVIQTLGPHFAGKAILHWYSGPLNLVEQAIENGLYFSVNPAMLLGKRFADLLALIPPDRLLTETDGPFVQVQGRSAHPADVALVAQAVALRWQCSLADASRTLKANFHRLLTG